MKKIIFGITSLTIGGAERVLVDIVNKLSDKYDITVFTIYSNGEIEKELNKNISLKSMYNKKYTELTKIEKIVIPLYILICKKIIFNKYIGNNNYEAQIAFLEGAITRIFSTRSTRKEKKIAWIHNDISKVFGNNLKSKIKQIIDKKIYKKYDTLVFVSEDNLNKFNLLYKIKQKPKKEVIYNYIEAENVIKSAEEDLDYHFNEKEINLVQVSRLVEQKAISRLIKIHKKLIDENIKHNIYIIGDGPLKSKLEEQIKKQHIEKTFKLLGAKTNPYPYIKHATAFCLFSNYEGYPMAVEEAKVLNKYIAITDTAAREVLQDYKENSIIVNNDEEGIEKAIRHIVKKYSLSLEKNSKYNYKNEKIIDKIIDIIEASK